MKKTSKPIGLAILICDELIEDKKTGKKSLIGLFNRIQSVHFPYKLPRFHVFLSLTGGNGKYKTELSCTIETKNKKLFSVFGDLQFKNPNAVIEADFEFIDFIFPEPGNYTIEFLCDGEMIFHRRFMVNKKGENK